MTKTVRIENADTSNYSVVVEVWDATTTAGDVLVDTHLLLHPTALKELTIFNTRYLKIREAAK